MYYTWHTCRILWVNQLASLNDDAPSRNGGLQAICVELLNIHILHFYPCDCFYEYEGDSNARTYTPIQNSLYDEQAWPISYTDYPEWNDKCIDIMDAYTLAVEAY